MAVESSDKIFKTLAENAKRMKRVADAAQAQRSAAEQPESEAAPRPVQGLTPGTLPGGQLKR